MAARLSISIIAITAPSESELLEKIEESNAIPIWGGPELVRVFDDIHGYYQYWFCAVKKPSACEGYPFSTKPNNITTMPNLNSCHFIGNITRDPESKYLPNGTAVCDFGIAINHAYKTDSGEKREEVTFVDCTAFGRTSEIIAEYAKKGKSVYLECRAKLDQWDDKQSGQKRSKIKFVVNNVQLLGSPESKPTDGKTAKTPDVDDSDIPY